MIDNRVSAMDHWHGQTKLATLDWDMLRDWQAMFQATQPGATEQTFAAARYATAHLYTDARCPESSCVWVYLKVEGES